MDFEDFAKEHSGVFMECLDLKDGEEHPIEFYNVYKMYLNKFEGIISDFIEKSGHTVHEFHNACKEVLEHEELIGSRRFFIETILSTSEYEHFYVLMKNEMQQLRFQRSRK